MADEGLLGGSVAGIPQDVPAEMQFLMAHYIDCVFSRHPNGWCLMHSEAVMRYFFKIAEVMGFRKSIGTEMISPLKFMGQSIDLAIDFGGKDVAVGIDPMPILGVTAPADWHMAWAQSVAENMGSYIIFRECGLEQVDPPSFRLFLSNPVACTTYFSSPQHIIALLARRKVREFFGLATTGAELLLVASKAPDQQAAMEKMAGCLLGKLCGFSYLEGAGGLWLDEIFSPQQLLIDVEIKHYVEGVAADLNGPAQDIVAVMKEGIRTGGFLEADLTLDRFKQFVWKSKLFDLGSRGSWKGDHQTLLSKTARLSEEKISAYTYELTDNRREALDAVLAQAKNEFGCETKWIGIP
jgi:trimethylamine:corrinoid methyltransferase-like protein